ncbi:efflux RND transporter periplasmic adaptor subunit [Clostridium oryzae]|uniref:p-hydroxybenzoic acid efflux pump subunit AaeA n=1 Tax=Clostridium oryzae TaxID=1450648 RepID=A0A1V4IH56_9CLOT|nr:efflux RND transporter periplasmic adaptor subunit [Clostridium oryzae]OPJ59331.1 p-hydroxybenzoic acid efflux pump subunit AaeA [Clostridium oryzae]
MVDASGIVMFSRTKNVVICMPPECNIKIKKMYVSDGMKIKKGQKLAELDLSEYNTFINEKESTIESDKLLRKDMQTYNQKKAQDKKIKTEQEELNSIKGMLKKNNIVDGILINTMNDGIISDIGYKDGDLLNLQQKFMTITDSKSLYIQANVDEEFIKDVKDGADATIIPTFDSSAKLKGEVKKIYNTAITQNGQTYVPVTIKIDNNNLKLLPNYNVDVEIQHD